MVRAISLAICLLMAVPTTAASLKRELEEAVGKRMANSIVKKWGDCDLDRYPQAQEVARKLLSHYPKRFEYELVILNSRQIKSFGCPGGYILISRGLIEVTGNRDHELAFPIARQIIYANKSKVLEKMVFGTAIEILLGGKKKKPSSKELASDLLTMLYNSQNHQTEYQIDQAAIDLMLKSGYNPKGALSYLRRLELVEIKNPSLIEEFSRTMPPAKERAEKTKKRIIQLYREGTISS